MKDEVHSSYTHRDDKEWDEMMRQRTAAREAAFIIPYLAPGLSIVDVGCGQGTITVDLADIVSPGRVYGFDPLAEHIKQAINLAEARATSNVEYKVGDIFDPPFPEETFDVAFSHMVFMHLPDPEAALNCVTRLVKPGGLIATRDRGSSFHIEGPHARELGRVVDIVATTTSRVSGSKHGHAVGEVMNRLCHQAGLEVERFTADFEIQPASSRKFVLSGPSGQTAIRQGVTSQPELDRLANLWEEWAADPDAYLALDHYQLVARRT